MRRRYVSLVCTPGFAEAHLLIFENEAKWATSNPPTASSPPRTSPPPPPPSDLTNLCETLSVSDSGSSSLLTIEQLLQADDGSRKGAKYVVRLDGLFFVGPSHVSVNNRVSFVAAIKSAFGKLASSTSTPSKGHSKTGRKPSQGAADRAGSAESYISTTSTPGPTPTATDGHTSLSTHAERPASICGLPSLNDDKAGANRPPTSLGLFFQDGSSTFLSLSSANLVDAWYQALSAVVATNRSRSSYPHIVARFSRFRGTFGFGARGVPFDSRLLNWPGRAWHPACINSRAMHAVDK
ncbi:unnamed protein product [Mesocestoides corti]|uniref:PH domain-containing protein n=1 Tax=Mesocestoides corti TaxID=53468 RepID=A0A0R3UMR5_MESCO|nr:unnamed protein product [Mesocestoides corti]